MRLLRAMLVLLPAIALAGWRQLGTVGTPVRDVQVVDAGVVLAVSDTTGAIAWQATDAGSVILNTLLGPFVGGGYYGANCLLGLSAAGELIPSPGCGAQRNLGGGTWQSFKLLGDQPLAVAVSTSGSFDTFFAGPGAMGAWASNPTAVGANANRSLQTAEIGGIDYTVVNTGSGVRVAVDGGVSLPAAIPGTSGWRDAAPFPLAGRPAILGVTTTNGLVLIRDYLTPVLFAPSLPVGSTPRSVGMGGVIGMATMSTGGLLSPIPDPRRPAEVWVVRPGPPATLLANKIHCLDDRFCAAASDAGVVWLWENEVGPLVSVSAPQVDAGQTIRLIADAGDADGDPVFVSWRTDAGVIASVAGVDDGKQVDFTAPTDCVPTIIEVTATDGVTQSTIQLPVSVINRGAFQVDPAPSSVVAGAAPLTLWAFIDGGCSTPNISWSSTDGQSGPGPTFSWVPPATECNAAGGRYTITTTAAWSVGLPSTNSVSQIVSVLPWGAPAAPVFASPGSQDSGTTIDWFPSGVDHACSTSNGFPGTELILNVVDAGDTTVSSIAGGVRISAPVRCTPAQVLVDARRQVIGEDAGRTSGVGSLVVNIVPDTAALDASTAFSITVQGDAGVVFGTLEVDASCLDERALSANVTIFSAGTLVVDGGFTRPSGVWPFELGVPGGCAGGSYEVVADLFEHGVPTGARAQASIMLPFTPARVGALPIDRLEVRCGVGARASLTLIPAANSCAATALTWRSIGGPALVTRSGAGDTINLQSEALDFSAVGEQVTVEWAADAGPGNIDVARRSLELAVQPFLEVSVKSRPPLRREEEAVAIDVILENTTSCAVDGLTVVLPLRGGSPRLDSVLIDGVSASARSTDDGVVIEGVSVPASGLATISLSARPRLLSSISVAPLASLRGYVVSLEAPGGSPATGCGCSQLSSTGLFGLCLILLASRRRSKTLSSARTKRWGAFPQQNGPS